MRPIDADAIKYCTERQCFGHGDYGDVMRAYKEDIDKMPTIDPSTLRPTGRCRYCSPNDGAGLQWDFEDIEVSITLQSGVLTICNQYGDEAEMPIRYCPNCGAKMEE